MRAQRKIQLTAAVVIANAVAALQLTTPSVAMAAACEPGGGFFCDYLTACSVDDAVSACSLHAPPGCTNVTGVCLPSICDPQLFVQYVICQWQ